MRTLESVVAIAIILLLIIVASNTVGHTEIVVVKTQKCTTDFDCPSSAYCDKNSGTCITLLPTIPVLPSCIVGTWTAILPGTGAREIITFTDGGFAAFSNPIDGVRYFRYESAGSNAIKLTNIYTGSSQIMTFGCLGTGLLLPSYSENTVWLPSNYPPPALTPCFVGTWTTTLPVSNVKEVITFTNGGFASFNNPIDGERYFTYELAGSNAFKLTNINKGDSQIMTFSCSGYGLLLPSYSENAVWYPA